MSRTRPPKTRRIEKNAETERRVLDAARTVFGLRGYTGATMDEVAAQADCSKGTLYYRYASKRDLFLALLDERIDARAASFSATDPLAAARDYDRDAPENIEFQRLFLEFASYAGRDEEFERLLAASVQRMRDRLTAVVRDRADTLDLDLPVPAETLALLIDALGAGVSVNRIAAPQGVPDDAFAIGLSLLLRGVAAMASDAPMRARDG